MAQSRANQTEPSICCLPRQSLPEQEPDEGAADSPANRGNESNASVRTTSRPFRNETRSKGPCRRARDALLLVRRAVRFGNRLRGTIVQACGVSMRAAHGPITSRIWPWPIRSQDSVAPVFSKSVAGVPRPYAPVLPFLSQPPPLSSCGCAREQTRPGALISVGAWP